MELASNFADKAASVTCVGRSNIPFANIFGEKIGSMLKKVFQVVLIPVLVVRNEDQTVRHLQTEETLHMVYDYNICLFKTILK